MTLLANADIEEAFRREERYKLSPVSTDVWLCRVRDMCSYDITQNELPITQQLGESANCMYRTTSASYQLLGFTTHEKLLLVVEELAEAESTRVMPAGGFNNAPSADPELVTEQSRLLTRSSLPQSTYNSFSNGDQFMTRPQPNQPTDGDAETATSNASNHRANRLHPVDESRAAAADPSEDETCIICYSNRGDICLMNCGHGGICFECASTLATKRGRLCPVCRGEIKKVLRVNPFFFWLRKGVGIFYSGIGYDVVLDDTADSIESEAEGTDEPGTV